MKAPTLMVMSIVLLNGCAPKSIQMPKRALAIFGDAPVTQELELRLFEEKQAVPNKGDPWHCTWTDPRVRVQVYDTDDVLLWERDFPRFLFARLDEQGVLVAIEGGTSLLAYDRDGRPRGNVPASGVGVPGDALTLERFRKLKPKPKPEVAIPEAALGPALAGALPEQSNPSPWVQRVAVDQFASFDASRTLRVTDTHNRVLWSMGLPEATAVAFKERQLVVTEPSGEFRLSIDGAFLSQPERPAAVAYESPLAFERVSAAPGGPLFVTSKGEFLGAFDSKVHRLVGNAWTPIPKLAADAILGFIEMPGKSPFALMRFVNEVGGVDSAILPIFGKEAPSAQEYPIDYSTFAAAQVEQTVVWSGYQSLFIANGSDTRTHKLSATPAAVAIYQHRIFLQATRGDAWPPPKTVPAGSIACPNAVQQRPVVAELVGDTLIEQDVELEAPITAMGVEGDHLWVAGHRELAVLREGNWEKLPSPLESVSEFWSPRAGIVWAVGVGGVARFDGTTWRRVLGPRGIGVSVRGRSDDDVWISTTSGVFHGTHQPSGAIGHVQASGDAIAKPAPFATVPLAPKPAKLVGVKAYPLPKVGTRPFHPHAANWIGDKLLLSNGTVHVLWDPKAPTHLERLSESGKSTLCFSCGAADDRGEPWVTRNGTLFTPKHPRLAEIVPDIGPIRAVASGVASLWVVGEVQSNLPSWNEEQQRMPDHRPVQLASRANGVWQQYAGLPAATYLSVSSRGSSDVWLAGSLTWPAGVAYWQQVNFNLPGGDGIVAHLHGTRVAHFRSPLGTLWAVAQDEPNSAWAVGVAGQVLHITDKVDGSTLAAPITLRDIAVVSPSERWVVGDRSTILHATSGGWETLESDSIPLDQSLTRALLDKNDDVWILGYGGLYRISTHR